MFKKGLYTFIVASHAGGKVWRLSLPYSILVTLGVFVLVGSLALGGAAFQYGKMLLKVVDYEHRIIENDQLRSENHEYKVQTAQLGEKVDILETLAHKLMVFSGINSDKAVGGVGGVSKDTLNRTRSASAGALQSIASYDKKISSLESKLRDLNNRITDGILVAAAAPSLQPVNGYITAGWGSRADPIDPSVKENPSRCGHLGAFGQQDYRTCGWDRDFRRPARRLRKPHRHRPQVRNYHPLCSSAEHGRQSGPACVPGRCHRLRGKIRQNHRSSPAL